MSLIFTKFMVKNLGTDWKVVCLYHHEELQLGKLHEYVPTIENYLKKKQIIIPYNLPQWVKDILQEIKYFKRRHCSMMCNLLLTNDLTDEGRNDFFFMEVDYNKHLPTQDMVERFLLYSYHGQKIKDEREPI